MAAAIAEGTTKASESAADHGGREGGSLLPAHVYPELGREAEWVSVGFPPRATRELMSGVHGANAT
jgi:hypothetical protein